MAASAGAIPAANRAPPNTAAAVHPIAQAMPYMVPCTCWAPWIPRDTREPMIDDETMPPTIRIPKSHPATVGGVVNQGFSSLADQSARNPTVHATPQMYTIAMVGLVKMSSTRLACRSCSASMAAGSSASEPSVGSIGEVIPTL